MTGPNGDSFDGFVFPPFIPTASRATPAPPPAPVAAPPSAPVEEPRPVVNDAVEVQPARVTMPWDAETPIVRDAGHADAAADEDEHEDLPWLEVPAPRERAVPGAADDVAPAGEETDEPRAAPAANDAFPDWMAWGATDEADAAREMGNVDPIAGLENLVPMNDAPPAHDVADEDATAAAFPVDDEPTVDAADLHAPRPENRAEDVPAFDLADLHAPRPEPRDQPGADADFLAAGFGGGDFLLRALQASQLAPAEEPVRAPVEDAQEAAAPAMADAQEIAPEPDPFTAAAVAEAEAFAPAEPDADVAASPVAANSAEQPAAVAHALADTFGEVAGRLEGIARTLRERPDSLLSGGSDDPLALLVTGYVLGYTQGRRS
ncbi:MAG TPA: hypothetical protein VGB24_21455 [Longimicrobium sp.]|jgi:hypothetical protein|uniref:hypothetical protein n=1 Tax=Longimicrobium sp. TaxID=2029185 RepID=UPI002ED8564A